MWASCNHRRSNGQLDSGLSRFEKNGGSFGDLMLSAMRLSVHGVWRSKLKEVWVDYFVWFMDGSG